MEYTTTLHVVLLLTLRGEVRWIATNTNSGDLHEEVERYITTNITSMQSSMELYTLRVLSPVLSTMLKHLRVVMDYATSMERYTSGVTVRAFVGRGGVVL